MKFLLIGFFGRTYMPYMKEYEKILQEESAKYDITCFERYETAPPEIKATQFGTEYTYKRKTAANVTSKLLPALTYFRFVRRLIKSNKYDRLIVFTTMPAIFLSPLLLFRYNKKYIYDYRDYTYEKFLLFSFVAKNVMNHAAFTCFSSKGYLIYYPDLKNYLITHNISNREARVDTAEDIKKKPIICIGFIGYIRYFDVNKQIVESFKNCKRYSLSYIGSAFSDCDLQAYCKEKGIENVNFYGTYRNEEKPSLYQKIDIINSVYSLNSPEVKQAIPNRIYDAALYKKPILVAKGTYLSEIVRQYDLGLVIDPITDNISLKVEEYIQNFNPLIFQMNCDLFLSSVNKDVDLFQQKVRAFMRGETGCE